MYFNSAVYVTEDSYLATYNVMRLGDIAFEGNRSKRFAHGRFVENTIGDGIVSHVFKVFRPVGNNYDLAYWKHAINNEKLMKDALTRSTKASTMMHELVSSDFLEESTLVPTLDEQRAIGIAIDSIDNLITLHQRKRQYRGLYGYLSWEQRKLGELCEVNPKTVLPGSFEYVDLESVVGTDMVSHRREEKLTAPSRAQRLASFGDIFYQTVRPYQKNNYFYELPDKDYVFSTGYAQLRPLCDGRFLFSSLQREQFVSCVLEHCMGTSYPAINTNDLAALPLAVPSDIEEQRLVGSILKPIDALITLHQREPRFADTG